LGRLSLVIADNDKDYLQSLEKYLVSRYPQKFDIYLFSSVDKLSGFLTNTERKDIILINEKIYSDTLDIKRTDTVLLLSENDDEQAQGGFERVKKYQHADRLVTDILRIHGSRTANACHISGGKSTRIVCIYSPAGGTGKTSIAVGCSILCAGLGLKTFYLNVENVPSTGLYFQSDKKQCFSNVIFHVKGRDANLGIKLEGARTFDQNRGVYFFNAPENILEMEELTEQDIECLVKQFKTGRLYDVVFVDMSCGLNPCNIALLKNSDAIVNVIDTNETSVLKMKGFISGIDAFENRHGIKILEKMFTVVNKSNVETIDFIHQKKPVVQIGNFGRPENATPLEIVQEPAFLSALNRLIEQIMPRTMDGEK